ncbi:MAG: hypothetical protein ACYC6F_04615 [Longimicrobiales bacterium]
MVSGRYDLSRWVTGYLLATPLFAVLDLGLGLPVRVATILPESGRLAYYAGIFALGLLCRARPMATPWVGMLESASNLTLLLLSILLPIWSFPLASAGDAPVQIGLTPAGAANALLSGVALVASFHRHEAAALGRLGSGRSSG